MTDTGAILVDTSEIAWHARWYVKVSNDGRIWNLARWSLASEISWCIYPPEAANYD